MIKAQSGKILIMDAETGEWNWKSVPDRSRVKRVALLIVAAVATLFLCYASVAYARDDGRYANSPLKKWFDELKSGKGPCCSDADGSAVADVDWKSADGHYSVRIDGEWHKVDDDAVIKVPNLFGRTMVWPMHVDGKIVVRCFMPGSMI